MNQEPKLKNRRFGSRRRDFIILLCFFLFVVFLLRSIAPANRSAKASVCMHNLKGIGVACQQYAQKHNGRFPDTLVQLYPNYIRDTKVFFCPSVSGIFPRKTTNLKETNLDYYLTPGLNTKDDPNIVLVRDKSAWNHKSVMQRFFVGYRGEQGYVAKIIEQDFDTIASALNAFFQAKGRYPTNEEGLEELVHSGYLRVISVDPFDPEGKRPYGYACNISNKWILTSYGPDKKQNIDLKLYAQGKLTNEDLMKMKAQLIFGMMTIKRTSGDVFRVEP